MYRAHTIVFRRMNVMKKLHLVLIPLLLTGCAHKTKTYEICNMSSTVCQKQTTVLKETVKKFKTRGGAFVLINMGDKTVLNAVSVSKHKDYDYIQDYLYRPKNINPWLHHKGRANPQQLIADYVDFVQSTDDETLRKLRLNVVKGNARKLYMKDVKASGLTSTDYKSAKSKEVVTTFVGHFAIANQQYALLTLLDEPKGLDSTFGFNSSGWNAVELARKIVETMQ